MNNPKTTAKYLTVLAGVEMLGKTRLSSALSKEANRLRGQVRMSMTDEEYQPIQLMATVIISLARKLANCENVEALEQSVRYVEALEKGEVHIAEDEMQAN